MQIRPLARDELGSVWSIDRSERVERVYRVEGGALVLHAEHHDVRGWPAGTPEREGPALADCLDRGGFCWGAFEDETLVGVAVLECRRIGRARDRVQLKFLHVSQRVRGTGVGTALFDTAAARARALGARAVYVSATPSENTVRFYLGRGGRLATEIDAELFAREPEDVHLEVPIPD